MSDKSAAQIVAARLKFNAARRARIKAQAIAAKIAAYRGEGKLH